MFLKEQFIPKKTKGNTRDRTSHNTMLIVENNSESSTIINSEECDEYDNNDEYDQLHRKNVILLPSPPERTHQTLVSFIRSSSSLKDINKL